MSSQTPEATQPPSQWVTTGIFLGSKAARECETDHIPTSSMKVKNEWGYNFTPTYSLMAYVPSLQEFKKICANKKKHSALMCLLHEHI